MRFLEPVELNEWMRHTPIDKLAPAAPVVLKREKRGWTWRIVRCPYCSRQHEHGGGGLDENPMEYLGGRVPHCGADGEYRLVAIEGKPTRDELDRHFPLVGVLGGLRRRDGRINPSPELKSAVWRKTGGRCWYCGEQTDPFLDFHVDHVTPVAAGGTNDLANLVPACRACNHAKKDWPLEVYRNRRTSMMPFWFEQEGLAP